MGWVRAWLFVLGVSVAQSGCHGRDVYDIARRDDEALRSKVDKLLLLVSVVERSPKGAADASASAPSAPRYVDSERIVDVSLDVDGASLGTCATQPVPASAAKVALKAERDAALVLCDFGTVVDPAELRTVGAWVSALKRTVGAGAHVLQVTRVTLRDTAGRSVSHAARQYLPFVVEDGAATAFAGRAELVFGEASP